MWISVFLRSSQRSLGSNLGGGPELGLLYDARGTRYAKLRLANRLELTELTRAASWYRKSVIPSSAAARLNCAALS